jgi:8-hydroxy-5-deazaflavin:NADPH oxidoreductase
MKIAVLGTGVVGQTLANGLRAEGHEVSIGSRAGTPIEGWDGPIGVHSTVLAGAEVAILAVKGSVAEELATSLAADLAGKVVIDTTNPISDAAPTDGVLAYFTDSNDSLLEHLQAAVPAAKFVKAFNSVGAYKMIRPSYAEGRPSMFICGNDVDAKAVVAGLVSSLGWDVEDMGTSAAARAIEPLCRLWCIKGFTANEWTHAFKLLH